MSGPIANVTITVPMPIGPPMKKASTRIDTSITVLVTAKLFPVNDCSVIIKLSTGFLAKLDCRYKEIPSPIIRIPAVSMKIRIPISVVVKSGNTPINQKSIKAPISTIVMMARKSGVLFNNRLFMIIKSTPTIKTQLPTVNPTLSESATYIASQGPAPKSDKIIILIPSAKNNIPTK